MGPFGKSIKGGICNSSFHVKGRPHDDVKEVKARYNGVILRRCQKCRIESGWEKDSKK